MNAYSLLLGILPLVLFVVLDSVAGLKTGVIAAILFALGELLYTLIVYQSIDGITIGSTLLILIFGLWSLRTNKPIYLKLQPVFLGVIFGSILIVMQLLGKPLMVLMIEKYQYMVPEEYRQTILSPTYLAMLARLSGVLGYGFIIHAALVAYSAFFLNKWWWLLMRGLGFYLMMFACVFYIRLT